MRTAALLLLFSTPLLAQEPAQPDVIEIVPPTRLVYLPGRFAATCPAELDVKEAIMRRLGRSPFDEPAERIVVLALDGPQDKPTRAKVELFNAAADSLGARDLETDEGCAELVESSALAISIALAPDLALAPAAPPPPVPVPVPVPEPTPVAVDEAPPSPPPPRTWQPPSWLPAGATLIVGAGTSGVLLLAPQNVLAVQTSLAVRQDLWELRLENRQHIPGLESTLGILHGGSGWSLLPCAHVPLVSLRDDGDVLGVQACASASTGNLWALGAYIGGAAYAGLGGRAAVEWTQADLSAVRAWVQLEWTAVRPSFFALNGPSPWEQTSPVHVVLGVSYDISWPP